MYYRLLLFLYRKEGMTHAEFKDHYEYIHIPLARELTGSLFPSFHLRRYIERSPPEVTFTALPTAGNAAPGGPEECDAVVEFGFADEGAAQAFFEAIGTGTVEERLRKDTEQFLNWNRTRMVKVADALETRREG
ncbi:hype protein [Colletotrichum eremochloae]|nr:hype protein [Colletotrichum eremochloae]